MSRLIKLLPGDVGRPIIDMSQAHLGPDLVSDAKSVLDNLTPVTRELGIASAWYVRGILPYRTSDNRIEGVVITYTDITERKRMEEETRRLLTSVQEEKDRLSALINSIQDEVWFADTDKSFTLTNPSALREFGFEAADGIDVEKMAASLEVYRPDGTPRPVDEAPPLRALKGEVVKNQEEIIRTPASGELRYRQVSAAPVRDGSGDIIGSVSVVRDVTEQRQAEEGLRKSEERLRALMTATSDVVYRMSPDWKEMRQLHGRDFIPDTNEPSHNWLQEYIHPDDQPHVTAVINEAIRTRSIFELEHRVVRVDGTLGWTFSRAIPLFDESGEIVEWFGVASDITERKQAEEELVKTKTLAENRAIELQAIMEAVPALVFITHDPQGSSMTGNRATYDLLGVPLESNVSKSAPQEEQPATFRAMRDGQEIPADQLPVQQAAQGHEVRDYELDLVFTDGTRRTVFGNATPLKSLDGGTNGAVGVFIDITRRRQAEEALRERAEELAALFEAVPMPVFIAHDPDCLHLTGNRLADEILRISHGNELSMSGPEETKPRHFRTFKDGRELRLDELPAQRSARGAHVKDFEFTLVFDDGMVRHVLGYGTPLLDDHGRPRGTVAVLVDITDRKRAEEALREAHDELEERVLERTEALRRQADLLELAYNAIIVRDLNSRVTFWNARAEEIYGFTREEALSQVTHTLLQTRFPVPFEQHMTALATQGRWEGELTHTTKDGRQIAVLSRQALQRDEAGRPVAIMEINLDITEQRRVEEHLRQAQKMEALGTLSGGIAHDFNNILAAIIGFTELVTGHIDRGSRDAHSLARVMEAAIRGRELVRQMLTFSRKSEHEKKPVSLSAIVRESVRLLRAAVPSSIDIKVDVASESGSILADPVQVQQVLMNLCTNAAHAMREKGGILDIKVDDFSVDPSTGNDLGISSGQYMRLMVRDTGIGMPPDVMKRIFDPFYTTKGVGEGTGLGLSVVHGIVEQHDGRIAVISEPGRGSTFTVYIPRIAEELETDAVSDDEIPTGSERVLFVDDEEALVEMGEDILAELGYDVTSRMNGREALVLLKSDPSRFDLVITDQTMPEMTGVELAKEVLALRPGMPIIMCTGFSHVVNEDKAKEAGIKAFAMKPLTKREIATTIRKVLDE
jgi:PAS domain S-box-containing protein